MKLQTDERGVALLMAIFIVATLTMTLAAAFMMISSERRVIENTVAQVDAFTMAEHGLELFLVKRDSFGFTAIPPAVYESTRVNLTGGYADVVLERIRPSVSGSPELYLIRSHGAQTGLQLSGTPLAERVVAQYAVWTTGTMEVRAALVGLTGIHKNGGSGSFDGTDQCGVEGALAGASVADPPGYTQSGGPPVPTGSPPVEDMDGYTGAADSVNIDWEGIVNGTALTPDLTIPGDAWPSFGNPSYWPVIMVNGDFNLPGDGRGTLIVTGALTIDGSKDWDGIILVGDWYMGDGNQTINGAMITGLNVKLGGNPDSAAAAIGQNTIGNGTKGIYYNSCMVASAVAAFNGLSTYSNAWTDNWPTY